MKKKETAPVLFANESTTLQACMSQHAHSKETKRIPKHFRNLCTKQILKNHIDKDWTNSRYSISVERKPKGKISSKKDKMTH